MLENKHLCLSTEERSIFNAPEPPKTTLEALTQRLNKYQNAAQQAKEEGNSSKSRRMGRIAKVSIFFVCFEFFFHLTENVVLDFVD